jgi:bifunctional NMN adenylyltransferase/nudix hydrolase
MIEGLYPDGRLTIVGSDSLPSSYEERSRKIDTLIRQSFPDHDAIIYGSRDSFVHTYQGIFSKHEVPTVYSGSATEVRKAIPVINSFDFRAGVIYATMNRKPLSHPAVDVVIVDSDLQRVLLVGKRDEEGKLRFPGVFFDPELDQSYEDAGLRCCSKEIPTVRISQPLIIKSHKVDDWRYRKTRQGVITLLMKAYYRGGEPSPGKGVDTVAWVNCHDVRDALIKSHQPLAAIMKDYW